MFHAEMVCNGVKNLNASDAMDACREPQHPAGQNGADLHLGR